MEEKNLNNEELVSEEVNEENISEEVSETSLEESASEEVSETSLEESASLEEEEEPYTGPVVVTRVKYDYRTMKTFNMYNMLYKKHFNIVYIVIGLISILFAGYNIISAVNDHNKSFDVNKYVSGEEFIFSHLYSSDGVLANEIELDKEYKIGFAFNEEDVLYMGTSAISENISGVKNFDKGLSVLFEEKKNENDELEGYYVYYLYDSKKVYMNVKLSEGNYVFNFEEEAEDLWILDSSNNSFYTVSGENKVYVTKPGGSAISGISLIIPIIFILFGAYFIYNGTCFEKIIDKQITMHFARQPKVVKMNVEVTLENVSIIIPSRESEPFKYPWAYVTEIVEIPDYFFLFVQKQPIIIEKDPNLVISGDYDVLLDMIEKQKEFKSFKKLDKAVLKKPVTYVHMEDNEFDSVESEVVEESVSEEEENE